jgi:hypothetical protein
MADDLRALWSQVRDDARASGDRAKFAEAEAELKRLGVVTGAPEEAAPAQASAAPGGAKPPAVGGMSADPVDASTQAQAQGRRPGLFNRLANRFVDQLGSELHTLGAGVGLVDPDAADRKRMERAEAFASNAAHAATMGTSDFALPEGAADARRQYASNPDNSKSVVAGQLAGALGGAMFGPAFAVDAAVARGVAHVAPRAVQAGKFLPRLARGTTSGVAQQTAQNAIETGSDPDRVFDNLGLPLLLGAAGPVAGKFAGQVDDLLRTHGGDPTWIGRYRDAVEGGRFYHPTVSPDEVASPGVLQSIGLASDGPAWQGVRGPTPAQVERVAPGTPMAMRDTRDAGIEAASRATRHRATKAAGRKQELEAQAQPYLGTRVSRDDMIQGVRESMAANTSPNLGPVNRGLHKRLQDTLDSFEATRPPPRPVLEGARVPGDQVEMAMPGAPPVTLDRPPTPAMEVPQEAPFQARLPWAGNDVQTVPVGGRPTDQWAPGADVTNVPTQELATAHTLNRPPAEGISWHRQIELGAPRPGLDPRAGQQLEIAAPPQPPAPVIPGLEPTPGGAGSYQRELPLPGREPTALSRQEAIGDPTIGELRRFRQEARKRAGFNNPNPTPAELDAQAEYFIYDGAIKAAAKKYAPGYLDVERQMGESAASFRREGDLIAKTEGNLERGGPASPVSEPRPDDLNNLVDEDQALIAQEGAAAAGARPNMRVAQEQGAATFFERVGDTNRPGRLARDPHEELAMRDPEYARHQQLVLDTKSLDAVRPGLRAMIPLEFNAAVGGSGWPQIAIQNSRALGGRLVSPLLGAVARTAPRSARLLPFLRDPLDAASPLPPGPLGENETDAKLRALRAAAERDAKAREARR